MNAGPTNRPKLVADPFVRVTDEEATLQLVAGLRFNIRADSVKREWDETRVPADVVAAQEAGPVWAFQRHMRKRLVLHAAAVVIDGGAVCIAARSGTGKSTVSAALRTPGAGILP